MVRSKVSLLIPIIVIALVIIQSLIAPIAQASSVVPLDTIKDRVQKAYDYLLGLKRDEGYYAVIAEYPSIPIVITDNTNDWWVAGLKYCLDSDCLNYYYVDIHDSSIEEDYYGTYYRWYMDLRYSWYVGDVGGDDLLATLKVTEYRGNSNSYVEIEVTYYNDLYNYLLSSCHVYLAGEDLGTLTPNGYYFKQLPDSPLPSMRTSVRHVDVIGALALANLAGYYTHEDLWNFVQSIMYSVFQTDKPLYDIYNSIFQGFSYTGLIEAPNEWHFYDAQWFSYGLGYYKIWEVMDNNGWIWRPYPIYPYKSKIVAYAEKYLQNGGAWFLSIACGTPLTPKDPLCAAWWGLWYAYQGDYDKALEEWNYIVSHWDGTGIYVSNQNGYSTLRLAMAIILGSILADKGYISWGTVHDMMNVLVQLQWEGSGYYSPDGSNVIWIVKPDHKGGFLVSYGEIGSYGFVPFRAQWWESIVDFIVSGTSMSKEYGGAVPTNAETTIIALVALMQYAYHYYGVPPSQLLS